MEAAEQSGLRPISSPVGSANGITRWVMKMRDAGSAPIRIGLAGLTTSRR
jgi:hypothetical protein